MVRRAVRRPFVTVVVVSQNAEAHIVRALESVLSQDFDSIQLVVSDRASSDRTVAICERIAEREIRLDVVQNASEDFAQAFDAGIAQARGEYVLVMGQDDWLAPGAVAALQSQAAARDLQLAIMALSVDERERAGERTSHVLRFSTPAAESAAAFRDEAPLFIREGMFSFVKGKLFMRDRIDELGLRMSLLASQTAFVAAYAEEVERAAAVEDALYHMSAESAPFTEVVAFADYERDHERMLRLASSWRRERDEELIQAIYLLHMRHIVSCIEHTCTLRGISSIERTARVRDIIEAASTRATVDALGKDGREFGFMYASIARKNAAGCCLSARFLQLARLSRLPFSHAKGHIPSLA